MLKGTPLNNAGLFNGVDDKAWPAIAHWHVERHDRSAFRIEETPARGGYLLGFDQSLRAEVKPIDANAAC